VATDRDALPLQAHAIVDAYLQSTGCSACHTDQDGLKPDQVAVLQTREAG